MAAEAPIPPSPLTSRIATQWRDDSSATSSSPTSTSGGGSSSASSSPGDAGAEDNAPDNQAQETFFHYYGMLTHQQNMLQDAVRTGTYQRAIAENGDDFRGKAVMDVGTGTGILAFFAQQSGARIVFAVEASKMAVHARLLVKANGQEGVIKVIEGKVESEVVRAAVTEQVDMIVSEPMGFLLYHERMLESFVEARNRFLKPGGKMFPSRGEIFLAPFTDAALYQEQTEKSKWWLQKDFYGVDVSVLEAQALKDHMAQPIVGYFDPSILIAEASSTPHHTVDFATVGLEEMKTVDMPFAFTIKTTALLHGIASWFDVTFDGSQSVVRLSTSPYATGTHWYQCRLLLTEPIAVNKGQSVTGRLHMVANDSQSFDVTLEVSLDGTDITSTSVFKLQDQMYHYLQHPTPAGEWDGYAYT